MDSAAYDSTNKLIIGVRGGRAFQFDPTTGVQTGSSLDYQNNNQLGLGAASIVWDNTNHVGFVTCWNTGNFNTAASGGVRKIYRIASNPLTVTLVTDFATLFGTVLNSANFEGGISGLRIVGTNVYGVGWNSTIGPLWCVFRFGSPALSAPVFRQIGVSGPVPSFAQATLGGDDVLLWGSQNGSDVETWDFTGSVFNSTAFDGTLGYVATEFASNKLFVTRQFQFIDQYDNSNPPVHQAVINTGRVNFNGVNIRLNPFDGQLYAAGGGDNTVIAINPATNAIRVITGFDLAFDFVFTPTVKFCVQQGSVPLKAFT